MSTDINPGISVSRAFPRAAVSDTSAPHVREATIDVDAGSDAGKITRMWESIGFDEINWAYTPTGRELLKTFTDQTETGYHVRPHYVLCSGNGFAIPHWGNGNVYHEDENGEPFYDFTIVDQTYDAIVEAGHHVLVEIAFTPRGLLPEEAKEYTVPSSPTLSSSYEHGAWSYPPKDYGRWGDLVAALVQHCIDRYGIEEVDTWLWELWNEPDIFYWRGTPEQFYELYSVTAAAVRSVHPTAKVGGPAVTGGGVEFLRGFLSHTSAKKDPLDFVSFHTKGSAFSPGKVFGPTGGPAPVKENPSTNKMLHEVRSMLRVMEEFPEYIDLPAIVDECDAGVPQHHGIYDNYNFQFQNTEYFGVFQVKLMKKLHDLNDLQQAKVHEATMWGFYIEAERYFEGTRSFITAGHVEKPVLNAYRALAQVGNTRLAVTSDAEYPVSALDDANGGFMTEEVDAFASRSDDGSVTVLAWRHSDDQYQTDTETAKVTVNISNLPAGSYTLSHARIDRDHSNSHTIWESLGSPQVPTAEQLETIKARQGLEDFEAPKTVTADDGGLQLILDLHLPAVSLLRLVPTS